MNGFRHIIGFIMPLLLCLLAACAPARVAAQPPNNAVSSVIVSLVVNPNGDAVCIASNSSSAAFFPRSSLRGQSGHGWFDAPVRISSAAWVGNAWWLALPRAGLAVKADGVPQSVAVAGQPSLLSSKYIFTLEGDIFRFDGSKVGRVPKLPSSLLETTNTTFVLSDKEVYAVANTVTRVRQLESANFSLVADGASFAAVRGITVRQGAVTYSLEKNTVRVAGVDNQLLKTIALGSAGSKIAVGADTLAVALGSSVAFFDANTFAPLLTRACEVTR